MSDQVVDKVGLVRARRRPHDGALHRDRRVRRYRAADRHGVMNRAEDRHDVADRSANQNRARGFVNGLLGSVVCS